MAESAYDPVKRVIDLVVGSIALVLSSPLQLVLAVLVRRQLGPPVLFRQERAGKDDKVFRIVKFRTMRDPDESRGLVSDSECMTEFGSWLRSTSLDELPTLWNVVKGDMSLVGPRPLLVCYLDRYSPEERRRHDVRPGLTGLVQVNGRNGLSWSEKFSLDLEYVKTRSLRLDAAIVASTFSAVIRRRGVNASEDETMPEFLGNGGAQ